MVSQSLRPREQCISARNRANRILGFITRSVSYRSPDVILRLYLDLIRSHLDYVVQFWSPYYRMDIDKLEAVQRRMFKIIQGIKNLTYKDRSKHLNLHSLERRRVRGGLIEVFQWVKGFNKGDINKVLIVKEKVRTQTNVFKLDKFRFRKDVGKNVVTNRVVEEWNRLNKHVVSSWTVDTYKKKLNISMDEENIR